MPFHTYLGPIGNRRSKPTQPASETHRQHSVQSLPSSSQLSMDFLSTRVDVRSREKHQTEKKDKRLVRPPKV